MTSRRDEFNPAPFVYDPATRYAWQVFDRVTVAVVAWNRRALTERCLSALYRHAGMPFDLLLIDNGSTDGTSEMLAALAAERPNVRLVANPENIGLARARMQVRDLVKDGLLVCLDNDIELQSALTLVHLQKAYQAYALRHGTLDAAFGIRLLNCEEYGFRHAAGVETLTIAADQGAAPRSSYAAGGRSSATATAEQVVLGLTDWLLGGAFCCPASVFARIRMERMYPAMIGGDDGFFAEEWRRLGVTMAYLENGPIARHNDWPYSEEKIALYDQMVGRRATFDLSYLRWKLGQMFR